MRSTRFISLLVAAVLLPLAGCPEEDEILTHGVVKLEMRRSDNQTNNPYLGTASVTVTMTYRTCLSDLYDANPDLRQSGREGELVFGTRDMGGEGWTDRLCEPGLVPAQATCSVISMEQRLDPVKQLTIEYGITGELENFVLPFGPIPTKDTAGCLDPIVHAVVGGTKGYNGDGVVIWEASSIEPLDAVTDQGGEVLVKAAVAD